jgi:hypothetical protein
MVNQQWLLHKHSLADEAQAAKANIEDEERVDSEHDPVLDNATASQNTNTGGEGPRDQNDVDRYARNPV